MVRVEGERVVERIQATGDLIPREEATVAAEVPGLVTRLHVDEGDSVARGAALLEIDPERRRLELASRQARVEEAEAALADQQRQTERVRELSEAKIASDAQRDQGELALRLARSRLTPRAPSSVWESARFATRPCSRPSTGWSRAAT